MPDVAEAGQYLAGYGIRMAIVVQDKAQLAAKYGSDSTKDIFSNVGTEMVFGVSDIETTRELSERIGFNTVPVQTQNRPRWWSAFQWSRQSIAEHPNKRGLLLPQEIARMSPNEQIVLRAGMMPVKCKRIRWFDDQNFTRLVLPPPAVPEIPVKVAQDDGQTPVPRMIVRGSVA
jgi:type IV secretion system protein VirD4